MRYKILVTIPFGYDDTLTCEYNGVVYDTYEEAMDVYKRIKTDDPSCTYGLILNKYIDEFSVDDIYMPLCTR